MIQDICKETLEKISLLYKLINESYKTVTNYNKCENEITVLKDNLVALYFYLSN